MHGHSIYPLNYHHNGVPNIYLVITLSLKDKCFAWMSTAMEWKPWSESHTARLYFLFCLCFTGSHQWSLEEEHGSEVRAVCEGWSSAVWEPCFKFSFIVIFFTNWIHFLFNINAKILRNIGWTSSPPPSPCYAWLWLELAQGLSSCYNPCEFICTAALLCPENAFSCVSSPLLTFTMFILPPPLQQSLSLERSYTVSPQVLLRAEHSALSKSLHFVSCGSLH